MSVSTLFSIPLEIRHEIYRLLLLARLNHCSFDAPTIPDAIRLHPAIMSTCHRAYQEAYSILYQENRWIMMETTGCTDHDGPSNEDIQPNMPAIKLPGGPFLHHNLIMSTKIQGFFCSTTCHLLKTTRMVLPLSLRALNNIGQNIWAYAVISDLRILIQIDGVQFRRFRLEAEVLEALEYITDCKYARLLGLLDTKGARKIERHMEQKTTPEDWVRAFVEVKGRGDTLLHANQPTTAKNYYLAICESLMIIKNHVGSLGSLPLVSQLGLFGCALDINIATALVMEGQYHLAAMFVTHSFHEHGMPEIMRCYGHYVRGIAYLGMGDRLKAFWDCWYAHILVSEGSLSTQPSDLHEFKRYAFAGYYDMPAEEMMPGMMTNKDTGKVYWVGDKRLMKQWEFVQDVPGFFERYVFFICTFDKSEGLRITEGLYSNGLLQYLNTAT